VNTLRKGDDDVDDDDDDVPCHMPFLPGTSLVSTVMSTARVSSFGLQYFTYYV
jgi:hypothetical protein